LVQSLGHRHRQNYARYLKQIGEITEERNELASQIKTVLNNAEFHNQPVDEESEDLGRRAKELIEKVKELAESEDRAER
jgi:seryl-tRNA synthetase